MYLNRIKTPEQLKQVKVGELGRLIGLDRIPETKCLRKKINLICGQQKARQLNNILIDHWYEETQQGAFLYVDGHVRIYYGHKANLPKKFVSRQKLCFPATTEFWVNDEQGLPVMMVMGELTEKLQEIIEHRIIPILKRRKLASKEKKTGVPVCTLIFDREAYEPAFFTRLWEKEQIAVITYRKNVKDKWEENDFKPMNTTVFGNTVTMQLCEKEISLNDCKFREIRRLMNSGHQVAIITTNRKPSVKSLYEISKRKSMKNLIQ